MHNSDRIYFSKFAVDPEFESNYEHDDLYDFDFDGNSSHFQDDIDYIESDEINWDSV